MIRLNLNGRRRNRNSRTGRAHRHHRVFPLTRFLVLIGMSAFTFLSLLNSEHLILKEALKQKNPDLQVLEKCGFKEDPS